MALKYNRDTTYRDTKPWMLTMYGREIPALCKQGVKDDKDTLYGVIPRNAMTEADLDALEASKFFTNMNADRKSFQALSMAFKKDAAEAREIPKESIDRGICEAFYELARKANDLAAMYKIHMAPMYLTNDTFRTMIMNFYQLPLKAEVHGNYWVVWSILDVVLHAKPIVHIPETFVNMTIPALRVEAEGISEDFLMQPKMVEMPYRALWAGTSLPETWVITDKWEVKTAASVMGIEGWQKWRN